MPWRRSYRRRSSKNDPGVALIGMIIMAVVSLLVMLFRGLFSEDKAQRMGSGAGLAGLVFVAFILGSPAQPADLHGGKQLPRRELFQMLEAAHIATSGQRGSHILGFLAQQGLICCGSRVGKQPTFVLLDEWVRHAKHMEHDAALAELTRHYY